MPAQHNTPPPRPPFWLKQCWLIQISRWKGASAPMRRWIASAVAGGRNPRAGAGLARRQPLGEGPLLQSAAAQCPGPARGETVHLLVRAPNFANLLNLTNVHGFSQVVLHRSYALKHWLALCRKLHAASRCLSMRRKRLGCAGRCSSVRAIPRSRHVRYCLGGIVGRRSLGLTDLTRAGVRDAGLRDARLREFATSDFASAGGRDAGLCDVQGWPGPSDGAAPFKPEPFCKAIVSSSKFARHGSTGFSRGPTSRFAVFLFNWIQEIIIFFKSSTFKRPDFLDWLFFKCVQEI